MDKAHEQTSLDVLFIEPNCPLSGSLSWLSDGQRGRRGLLQVDIFFLQ